MLTVPIDSFIAKLPLFPLIDIRPAEAFGREHIPGAVHYRTASALSANSSILLYGDAPPATTSLAAYEHLPCFVLAGGYASFLQWRENTLAQKRQLFVIAGKTGTGKTKLLHYLKNAGEPIIDLEALAGHRGSVFGATFPDPQPTQAQFLNLLALEWHQLDPQRPTFIEWEADYIGELQLPEPLVQAMRTSPGFRLETPPEKRIENILEMYGQVTDQKMMEAILKLTQRLGHKKVDRLLELLVRGRRPEVVEELLGYYDAGKHYQLPSHLPAIEQLPERYQRIKNLITNLLNR